MRTTADPLTPSEQPLTRLSLRVPKWVILRLGVEAAARGMTTSALARALLNNAVCDPSRRVKIAYGR
ncbi:MAG: hypothetical protein HZB55_23735 [Deltaproteobacteria bacterium]|nr:hypothetical protein [Deltaproteobacteria bacterium]